MRRARGACRLAAVAAAGLMAGACGFSMNLGPIGGGSDEKRPEVTGSVSNERAATTAAEAAASTSASADTAFASSPKGAATLLSETDWGYARGALGLALSGDGANDVPWANPETGVYGHFRAAGAPLDDAGKSCRAFTGARSEAGSATLVEGMACRGADGVWAITAIKAPGKPA